MKFKTGQIVRIQPNSNEDSRDLYSAHVHHCVTRQAKALADFPLGTLFIIEEYSYAAYSLSLRPLCGNYSTSEKCNYVETAHLALPTKPLLRKRNEI